MNIRKQAPIALAVAFSLALSSCATTDPYTGQTQDPNDPNRTRAGALIGAGIGAVAGLLSGGDATERRQRALVGAGTGALAGGAVGVYQDRQEAEFRRNLAGTGVEVVRDGDNITLVMPEAITFAFDSDALSPQSRPVLERLADTLNEYPQTIIEVAGHTDSVGSAEYNQALSERRAQAVSSFLTSQGVSPQRIIVVGAGESRPIASNETAAGRALNRRVEVTVVPLRD